MGTSVNLDSEEGERELKEWEKDPLLEKCKKISEGLTVRLD